MTTRRTLNPIEAIAALRRRMDGLHEQIVRLQTRSASTSWTAPTLTSGWSNFQTLGTGFSGPEYRKVGDIVELRGLVRATSAAGTTIFTLPTGFRPPINHLFVAHVDIGSTEARGRVNVLSAGTVELNVATGNADPRPGDDWVSLNGIRFSTTA